MLGIVGIADRTPSPRGSALTPAQGKQNKHSPWTAARNRKKNRVQEEERPLPLYDDNSEEENQPTASGAGTGSKQKINSHLKQHIGAFKATRY